MWSFDGSLIYFLEIKRYQTSLVLKGVTNAGLVFISLSHCCLFLCTYISLKASSAVTFSVTFLLPEQVSFALIQAPTIRYAYR